MLDFNADIGVIPVKQNNDLMLESWSFLLRDFYRYRAQNDAESLIWMKFDKKNTQKSSQTQ